MMLSRTRAHLRRFGAWVTSPRRTKSSRRERKRAIQGDYPGPRELQRLILDTQLDAACKLLLITLTHYADWGTWGGITVTQKTLAEDTSYSREWVGKLTRRLMCDGLLAVDSNGRRQQGRIIYGNRVVRRFSIAELERLVLESGRDRGRGPRSHLARTPFSQGVNPVPTGREPSSQDLLSSPLEDHPPPPLRAIESGEPRADREHPQASAEAEQLLVEFGVYGPNARMLAGSHTAEEVREGIARVKGRTRSVQSPSGLLVSLLRDGGLARIVNRRRAQHSGSLNREMRSWRIARVGELMGAIGSHRHSPNRDEILAQELAVRSVWPTNEDIAASGVLSDDELRAAGDRPLQLLRQLAAAAAEHAAAAQPARAGVRSLTRAAPKGGRE